LFIDFIRQNTDNSKFPLLVQEATTDNFIVVVNVTRKGVFYIESKTLELILLPLKVFKQRYEPTILADANLAEKNFISMAAGLCKSKFQAIPRLEAGADPVALFNKDKVLCFKDMIQPKDVMRIANFIEKGIAKNEFTSIEVGKGRRLHAVPVAQALNNPELFANQEVEKVLKARLGEEYVINSVVAVQANDQSDYQVVHSDHPGLFGNIRLDDRVSFAMVLGVPLKDVNWVNGTTRFSLNQNDRQAQRRTPLTASVGDTFLYDYSVVHQGIPTLEGSRTILFFVYSRSWFQEVVAYRKLMRLFISSKELKRVSKRHLRRFYTPVKPMPRRNQCVK
jgi:hypothetical protein